MSRRWLLPVLALLSACGGGEAPFVRVSGLLLNQQLNEVSGLAASRRHADVLWVHNDGGNPPYLYAVSPRGRLLVRMRVAGVPNTDWEDMSAFELDGRRYLLLADIGDNGGLRKTLQLHVIEEPRVLDEAAGPLRPVWSIVFRWPGGARDSEAVAVDAARGEILLIGKRRYPPQLFAVPLRPRDGAIVTARALGALAGMPAPEDGSRLDVQVTGADIHGDRLAVLSYGHVLVYQRRPGEDWARAVARTPRRWPLPWLPQAEAIGWSVRGDALYVTGELPPAPLLLLTPGR